MKRRFLCVLLALSMMLLCIPAGIFAEDGGDETVIPGEEGAEYCEEPTDVGMPPNGEYPDNYEYPLDEEPTDVGMPLNGEYPDNYEYPLNEEPIDVGMPPNGEFPDDYPLGDDTQPDNPVITQTEPTNPPAGDPEQPEVTETPQPETQEPEPEQPVITDPPVDDPEPEQPQATDIPEPTVQVTETEQPSGEGHDPEESEVPEEISVFEIDGNVLVKYNGDEQTVTVPSGITTIGSRAFYQNQTLRKVILPDSVKIIKSYAFAECSSLEEVVIGQNSALATIAQYAFMNDKKLDISFADNVSGIVSNAFEGIPAGEAPETEGTEFTESESNEPEPSPEPDTALTLSASVSPAAVPAAVGDTASFTVVVENAVGAVSYQWMVSTDGGTTWGQSRLGGYNTDTLSFNVTSNRLSYRFRCAVTAENGTVESNEVYFVQPLSPTVTADPVVVWVTAGENAVFHANVENATGNVTYQWMVSTDGEQTWKNSGLGGNKTATFSFPATDNRLSYRFRCNITAGNGTAQSNVVRFERPVSLTVAASPDIVEVSADGSAVFHAAAENAAGTVNYQWMVSRDGGSSWTPFTIENDTDTLTVEATDELLNCQFRCDVIASNGSGSSNAVWFVRPAAPLSVSIDPAIVEAAVGGNAQFHTTVENAIGTISYLWKMSADNGDTWAPAEYVGFDTDTLTVDASDELLGTLFRCTVTAENGSAESGSAWFVRPEPNVFTMDYGTFSLTYLVLDNTNHVRVIGHTADAGTTVITIPANPYSSYTVTEIGEEAFMGNQTVVSVVIPDTVTVIRARAFKNCPQLKMMQSHE